MRKLISRIGASVRYALGKTILPDLAARVEVAMQKAAASKLPQATRLCLLYLQTKRQYKKRRLGDSAKSPRVLARHRALRKAGKPCSHERLAPAQGINTYSEHDALVAQELRERALS